MPEQRQLDSMLILEAKPDMTQRERAEALRGQPGSGELLLEGLGSEGPGEAREFSEQHK